MKTYIVHITNRVHSLVQIPYYECKWASKEKAKECFDLSKEDFLKNRPHPDWWEIDIDEAEDFEADISDYRDFYHLYIKEAETDEEFVEGEWTRGFLGEDPDYEDDDEEIEDESPVEVEEWIKKVLEIDDLPF